MRWRWMTIAVTVALFAAVALRHAVRAAAVLSRRRTGRELIVDWTLPQNTSIAETKAQMERFEQRALDGDPDIDHWSSYVGQGAVRFVLSFDVQPANPYFGQIVIVTKGLEARDRVKARARRDCCAKTFVGTDAFVKLLDLGPPVGRPVQYRVSGPDIQTVARARAGARRRSSASNPQLGNVVFDWNEPARVVKVDVLQDKARQLGVTSEDIATTLNGVVGGAAITQVRDSIYLINVVGRARDGRARLDRDVPEPAAARRERPVGAARGGRELPLRARAAGRSGGAAACRPSRSRPSIVDATQPATVVKQLEPQVDAFIAQAAGRLSGRGRAARSRKAARPRRRSRRRAADAVHHGDDPDDPAAELPAGCSWCSRSRRSALIGVVAALLPSGAPLGFVAILGVLALIGILIRNSVILIVQIEQLARRRAGPPGRRWSRRPSTACGRSC